MPSSLHVDEEPEVRKQWVTFSFLNENVDTATLSGPHVDEALEVRKQRGHLVS
jgi:hypothetical protein